MLDNTVGHGDRVLGDAVLSYTMCVMLHIIAARGDMILVAAVIS